MMTLVTAVEPPAATAVAPLATVTVSCGDKHVFTCPITVAHAATTTRFLRAAVALRAAAAATLTAPIAPSAATAADMTSTVTTTAITPEPDKVVESHFESSHSETFASHFENLSHTFENVSMFQSAAQLSKCASIGRLSHSPLLCVKTKYIVVEGSNLVTFLYYCTCK